MHWERETISRSQLTNGAVNRIEGRRYVVPETMGSTQPTAQVGILTGRKRDIVPDTMGSSQRVPQVGTLNVC